ncbi:MAG: TylF/MycF/NovP-related O-methyltransferase [Pseudolabrys sp.]
MNQTLVDSYLNLMVKALSFSLWPEPPHPLLMGNNLRPAARRQFISILAGLLQRYNLELVKRVSVSQHQREHGTVHPLYGDTMIGTKRLANIRNCAEIIFRDKIEGDFIETGVWRGGACIFMRAILSAYNVTDRKIFVADSFEGLPPPDARFPSDIGDRHHLFKTLQVSLDDVKNNFAKYDLLDDQVIFLKGFFSETLPTAKIDKLALLRLDGDMYGSTMDALQNLYPKLQSGGFCIVDDFDLPACRAAVNDFRKSKYIVASLVEIDQSSVFWRRADDQA